MRFVWRIAAFALLFAFFNCIYLCYVLAWPLAAKIAAVAVLAFFCVLYHIYPRRAKRAPTSATKRLLRGRELALMALALLVAEAALCLYALVAGRTSGSVAVNIVNAVFAFAMVAGLVLNGVLRMSASSGQLGVKQRVLLLWLWWVPVYGQILLVKSCRTVLEEHNFACLRSERNAARSADAVCRTKYPLLLVHGIFFRDGKMLNYWGRIPEELQLNGAAIFYGNQQSSSAVEKSAAELKARIEEIRLQTGCEKVNIIAHSKGGLDSRYTVSRLGMAPYVASLTTINTPHRGCRFAAKALQAAPDGVATRVDKTYDAIFRALGDNSPDFLAGVGELTDEACAKFNAETPDAPGVFYQSVGSKMGSGKSAAFPLNLTYRAIRPLDGDNDGLVATHSMQWGHFHPLLAVPHKDGISHGDMIDLARRDIRGFDVREYYVELVSGLRRRGF